MPLFSVHLVATHFVWRAQSDEDAWRILLSVEYGVRVRARHATANPTAASRHIAVCHATKCVLSECIDYHE